ncbi:MAG: tetratricopeptide repeat protein, partial [Kiritimatiellaeota bacterium]|nr:tetratricopeptide repeat protein [Kiritimatiellota bacterium]
EDIEAAHYRYALSQDCYERGDYDDALLELEKVARLAPKHYADTVHHATLLARAGKAVHDNDLATARSCYEQICARHGDSVESLAWLLHLDYRMGDKSAAQEHAAHLLRLDPNHWLANYIVGSLKIESHDWDNAIEHLERSVSAQPYAANLNDLAYAHFQKGNLAEAMKHVQAGLALDEKNYALWDTYGEILVAEKLLDEAEKSFKQSIQLDDADPRIRLHLADLYVKKGDTDNARAILSAMAETAESLTDEAKTLFEALRAKLPEENRE